MNNIEQINLLSNELEIMRERYLNLANLHGQLQIQNSLLEERILSLVETHSNEKDHLEQELSNAKRQIINLQDTVNELQNEKQRYKDDCNLAVRLLHRHPNEFVSTTSGNMKEHLRTRFEPASQSPTPSPQRSILMTTFPPTFVVPPPLISTTNVPSIHKASIPNEITMNDSLRLATETLFKSNSVHRFPTTQSTCSQCLRIVKCCDVSVQTPLENTSNSSRLRLLSTASSDDGVNNEDAWLSIDSNHSNRNVQEKKINSLQNSSYYFIPQMHHV